MKIEQAQAIFVLAGISVKAIHRLENKYWPDVPEYAEDRRRDAWWLAITDFGPIEIGWRKRVINIDWESTAIRGEVTKDDVTKSPTMVHAWSYWKAVQYLTDLKRLAESTSGKCVPA